MSPAYFDVVLGHQPVESHRQLPFCVSAGIAENETDSLCRLRKPSFASRQIRS